MGKSYVRSSSSSTPATKELSLDALHRAMGHVVPAEIQPPPGVTRAAVLVLCTEGAHGLEVLLTRRSHHVRDHKGQISFPGGAAESTDRSLLHTALREAEEEVGLDQRQISVLGRLGDYVTVTRYHIRPFVAETSSFEGLAPCSPEIEEVFAFPLAMMTDQSVVRRVPAASWGSSEDILFVEYRGYTVWGATARILLRLVEVVQEYGHG